jgi:hypothetical protein
MRSRGRMLELISSDSVQRPSQTPLIVPWSGAWQPFIGCGPLSCSAINRKGAARARNVRFLTVPRHSPRTLIPPIRRCTETRGTCSQRCSCLHHLQHPRRCHCYTYTDARRLGQDPLEVTMNSFLSVPTRSVPRGPFSFFQYCVLVTRLFLRLWDPCTYSSSSTRF